MQPSALHPAVATSFIDHHHLGLTLQSTPSVVPHKSFHPALHVRRVMLGWGPVKTHQTREFTSSQIQNTKYTAVDHVEIRSKVIKLKFHLFKSQSGGVSWPFPCPLHPSAQLRLTRDSQKMPSMVYHRLPTFQPGQRPPSVSLPASSASLSRPRTRPPPLWSAPPPPPPPPPTCCHMGRQGAASGMDKMGEIG